MRLLIACTAIISLLWVIASVLEWSAERNLEAWLLLGVLLAEVLITNQSLKLPGYVLMAALMLAAFFMLPALERLRLWVIDVLERIY